MAKGKTDMFWLGRGVIHIDGKEYGADVPLPVDKMETAALKRRVVSGDIGEKIAPAASGVEEALRLKLQDSERAKAELAKELEACEANLIAAEAQIAELSKGGSDGGK